MAFNATEKALLLDRLQTLEGWETDVAANMDQFFLIIMGMVIYFMQAGFAFLEAGAVRSKNTTNILIKNLLDSFISGVSYWLFGYAFAFGQGNAFIGHTYFAHSGMPDTDYAFWFFQYVFAATAATIVSGAVAERCEFVGYFVYSTMITGFIYPIVTHWAWSSEGWLSQGATYMNGNSTYTVSYADFAGSGVVHTCGGVAAFVAAAVLGPRVGRFDKDTKEPLDIKGHSVPLAALGGFILIFGFFAFNGSSQGSISAAGDGAAVAVAVKNTVIAATAAALVTLVMNKLPKIGDKKWSFQTTLNGCLTGMVAVCAGCNVFTTYSAFVVGLAAGVAYMITTWLVLHVLKVDDPLDAVAVHYGGGVWGVIAVGLLDPTTGVFYKWDRESGLHLAWQLCGLVAIIAWTAVTCLIMFFALKFLRILRVPFDYERKGLDIPKHGEAAYPAEAYGHGWGEKDDTLFSIVKQSAKSSVATAASNKQELGFTIKDPVRASECPEVDALKKEDLEDKQKQHHGHSNARKESLEPIVTAIDVESKGNDNLAYTTSM